MDQWPAAEQGSADDRTAGENTGSPPERGVVAMHQRLPGQGLAADQPDRGEMRRGVGGDSGGEDGVQQRPGMNASTTRSLARTLPPPHDDAAWVLCAGATATAAALCNFSMATFRGHHLIVYIKRKLRDLKRQVIYRVFRHLS